MVINIPAYIELIATRHYRFIGVIENPVKEENIVLEAKQGVTVEHLTA